MKKISLVIPSRNNLPYLQSAYNSIRKHIGVGVEIIMLDDASSDGTWQWLKETALNDIGVKISRNDGPERIGHCILYDVGAKLSDNEIFGIFHADMIATPNYVENMLKHLVPGTVVSGTRIEPPLHPPGPEKFVQDFGINLDEFKEKEFLDFAKEKETTHKDQTTKGVFAPWVIYKNDFFAIGGHDKRVFSPMELEDSDLFNRFLLKGYNLIQSRDAFVYHMTCRGSRFKDGIKIVQEIPLNNGNVWKRSQDSDEYIKMRQIKFRDWWRKWHMDVLHDANMLPIVNKRYNVGFVVESCTYCILEMLEPWCDTIYIKGHNAFIDKYVSEQQPISKFNIRNRVKPIDSEKTNDILIYFNGTKFFQPQYDFIKNQLSLVLSDSGDLGTFEHDIFKLEIRSLNTYEKNLIDADDPWYVNQLV